MGEAVGGVLAAARSRQRHRRHAVRRHGVAHIGAGNFLGDAARADEGEVGGPFDCGARLAHELVGQHDGRRLQRFGEIGRPLRGEHAVADRLRRQHQMRRVAVHAVDGDVQIGLFGLGRNAGRRSAAHHVDHDDGDFRRGGEPERLDHQRKPGAGGRGQRRRAAVRCADDHVDGGEFVLGLQQRAADFDQIGRQPFEDVGRRRDRIGGGETDAAADGAECGRLVARHQPALGGALLRRGQFRAELDAGGGAEADLDAGKARLDGGVALVGEALLDRREDLLDGEAEQPGDDAERDHVGPPVGNGLGHLLHRDVDDAGAGFGDHRRQVAAARVADHQGLRPGLDFRAETVGVEPVDADQQVVAVGQRLNRLGGKAQQGGRFAAADLRAHGAGEQALPAGGARRLQQAVAGGERAGAAAAEDRDRETGRGCHGHIPSTCAHFTGPRRQYVFKY